MDIKVLDLFSGAGGLSYGFKTAGMNIVGAVEFDKDALDTHELNFPNSINLFRDITKISDEEISLIFGNDIDVIIGGPPCQGFSAANMWQSEEEKKEKNKLFFEYIRFIQQIKPKVFVIENVRQIFSKDDGYAKKQIEKICGELGYEVSSSILDSSKFGVPQKRIRAFFVGIRNDLGKKFDFEKLNQSEKIVSVKDAISDLYEIEESNSKKFKKKPLSDYQKQMRLQSKDEIYNHDIKYPNLEVQERMSHVPQGGNWRNVPTHLWHTVRYNRHSSAYRRLDESTYSITIDTGHMNYFHPLFNRVPTVRESARLQSFPDHFIFKGSKVSQFRQVGNAVPPMIAKSIAVEIKRILEIGYEF